MLHVGVTIPATVPQKSEIPEMLMNYPVYYVVEDMTNCSVGPIFHGANNFMTFQCSSKFPTNITVDDCH